VRVALDRLLLRARAGARGLVLQLYVVQVVFHGTMLVHIEDGLLLDGLEFGLELLGTLGVRGRVAATAGVVLIVSHVLAFVTWVAPWRLLVLSYY
jgi:hypothetical protein